ncbi:hypothetical protein [Sandaracinus amylolyticus]|uniref:Uncharacterized protein n=1 Tax=Sandaracinus amylolyticus TaxID=927083 RepID=A0A0F6W4X4_9BACT|nr:hypothetical protein [Sandaracinus amylolyticus]AKF07581.1 hypothetical protein DB32_004730 [Sandaracinus amylolyticus]
MRALVVALVAACAGCGAWDAESRARDRARDWIDCDDVDLVQRAESAWRASGCGRHVDVACTTSDNEPECIRVRFADASGAESATTAPVETSGGESAPSGDDAATSAVRASLDARREDVLACASSERVVVRVEWDATGAITLGLGGELGGSAEEGCVRAALADLRAPSGAPGSLLHLVRR